MLAGEVFCDGFYVGVDDGLFAGSALDVLEVVGIVVSNRLVPVRESDTLIDQTTLEAKIRRGIEEYEQGKVHRMEEGESKAPICTTLSIG